MCDGIYAKERSRDMLRYYDTHRCCYSFRSKGALEKFINEHIELASSKQMLLSTYDKCVGCYYCFFTDVLGHIKIGVTNEVREIVGVTVINVCLPQRTE